MSLHRWTSLASGPRVVHRAIKVSLIVGTLLILINHGPALITGEISGQRLFQIGLTYVVPYGVATWSAVSALLERDRLSTDTTSPRKAMTEPPVIE